MGGRLHGVLVSQSRKLLIGKTGCQLIDKMNQAPRRSSFPGIECTTGRTGAIGIVTVILTDGNHVSTRICLKNGIHPMGYYFQHFGIGQTQLAGIAGTTDTIYQGIANG